MKSDKSLNVGDIVYVGDYKGVVIDRHTSDKRYAIMLGCGVYLCGECNTLEGLTEKVKLLSGDKSTYSNLTTDSLKIKLIDLIATKENINSKYIKCDTSIGVCISVFSKEKSKSHSLEGDYNEPILEQYVLVPISKIKDRLDIII